MVESHACPRSHRRAGAASSSPGSSSSALSPHSRTPHGSWTPRPRTTSPTGTPRRSQRSSSTRLMLGILLLIARGIPLREAFALQTTGFLASRARPRARRARCDLGRQPRAVAPARRERGAGSRAGEVGLEPCGSLRRLLRRRRGRRADGRGAHLPRPRVHPTQPLRRVGRDPGHGGAVRPGARPRARVARADVLRNRGRLASRSNRQRLPVDGPPRRCSTGRPCCSPSRSRPESALRPAPPPRPRAAPRPPARPRPRAPPGGSTRTPPRSRSPGTCGTRRDRGRRGSTS